MNDGDRRLQLLFASLRKSDETDAPDFAALLSAPAAGSRTRLRPLAVFLCCGALAVAAVVVVIHRPSPRPAVPPISAWTSPTASLLPGPSPLLARAPTLGESWLEIRKEASR